MYRGSKTLVMLFVSGLMSMGSAGESFADNSDASPPTVAGSPASLPPPQQNAASGASEQLQEVIVTAQKRSENVKEVPISITVLGGNELKDQHIDDYDDISREVPGLSFAAGSPSGGSGVGHENLEVRGISSSVGKATVGLYLDDTPLTLAVQSGTAQPELLDIDHIEVLRGPQGTLYGSSSEGGTIVFHSKLPDLDTFSGEFTSDLGGTYYGGVNYDQKATINVPIVKGVLGVRATIEYGDQSGWINKYAHAGGALLASDPVTAFVTPTSKLITPSANDLRQEAVKLLALYTPSDDLTITPSFYYQRQHQSDAPDFILTEGQYGTGATSGANVGQFVDTRPEAEFSRDIMAVSTLKVEKTLDLASLTSVSSYFYRQNDAVEDGTFYDPDVVVPFYLDTAVNSLGQSIFTPGQIAAANTKLATLPNTSENKEINRVGVEEIRLTSREDSPVKWVAGLYFDNDTDVLNHYEQAQGWQSNFQAIFGFSPNSTYTGQIDPGTHLPIVNPISSFAVDGLVDPTLWNGDKFDYYISKRGTRDEAGFGQVGFDILPSLHATAGIRYQVTQQTYAVNEGAWWNLGIPPHGSGTANAYAVTPKFSVTYDLNVNTNIYAQAAKGYRVGGTNDPVPPGLCGPYYKQIGVTAEPATYGPDKLWSYELGTKSRILDNSLSVDADIYHIEWQDVQQQILIPVCFFDYISNVGNAEADGAEMELHYKVRAIPGLQLNFAGSVQKSFITSSSNPAAAATGQKLLFAPDWTTSASFSYTRPIAGNWIGFIRGDYDWIGRSNGDFQRSNADYSNKQYGILNGSIGAELDDLEIRLYAKNLTDNLQIIKSPVVAGITEGYTLMPITVGLAVTKRF